MEALTDYLRHKTLLLVLDNCEHLIDACAWLVTNLLRLCPDLKILPSSREALGVAGETTYRLPSLSLPDKNQPLSAQSFSHFESVRLFVDRAQAARPSCNTTEHNLSAIAQICWRLDGIPLALELAAARVKMLTVEQIAERIDDRFRLLTGGSRTALPRQQTIRAMIDWSYDLLSDPEKAALLKLSVFVGGCKFEAAEALVGSDALDLLSQLVNRSMVVVDEEAAEVRYRLLETIRQYAGEKLFEAQEAEQARIRHLAYYLTWVENSESLLFGPEMIAYFDQLEVKQENLRAALAWVLTNEPMAALRMVAVLYYFWSRRVSPTKGLHWVKTAVERSEVASQVEGEVPSNYLLVKTKALSGQAYISFMMGDNLTARSFVETSISLARQINASRTLAMALSVGALIGGMLGDVVSTLAWANEGITLCRERGDVFELGLLSGAFLFLARNNNEPYQSALQVDHLQAARLSGNPMVIALALFHQAQWAVMKGDLADAYVGFEQTAELFHQMRDRPFYNSSRSEMGHILSHQGRYQEAAESTVRQFASGRNRASTPP